jgi:hypothetical protein
MIVSTKALLRSLSGSLSRVSGAALRVALGAALVIGIGARPASALQMVFTDEAAFNAALAAEGLTTRTESFEGVETGFHGALDFGAFALEPQFLNAVTDFDGAASDGANALYIQVPDFLPTFKFDSPIRAFSFDAIGALELSVGDMIYSVDNRPNVLFRGKLPEGHVQFFGFIDTIVPFTNVRIFSSEFIDVFTMDRIRYEAPASPQPVPEPASLTLLAAGLATGAVRRYRRGRVHA